MTKHYLNSNLAELRKASHLTQQELAERLGISRSKYAAWEEYRACPMLDDLVALADLYEISLDDIIKVDLRNRMSFLAGLTEKCDHRWEKLFGATAASFTMECSRCGVVG